MFIFELSSRFHLMVGCGEPCARHFNVMFEPSRTITSLELKLSSMLGGTVRKRRIELMKISLSNWMELKEIKLIGKCRRNRIELMFSWSWSLFDNAAMTSLDKMSFKSSWIWGKSSKCSYQCNQLHIISQTLYWLMLIQDVSKHYLKRDPKPDHIPARFACIDFDFDFSSVAQQENFKATKKVFD